MKRLLTILSLILFTSVAYSQQDIVMTVDDVLEKEMVGMDKVFYIIVDSTLYPLPHIKDDKYRIPKTIIDRISEVDTFYFYLETNKGYYWRSFGYDDLFRVWKVSFEGFKKIKNVAFLKRYSYALLLIPTNRRIKFATISIHGGYHSRVIKGIANYQKKR